MRSRDFFLRCRLFTKTTTFRKQTFYAKEQNISPVLDTTVITTLQQYFERRFTGTTRRPDDKPQAVVCFDTSGSGKRLSK